MALIIRATNLGWILGLDPNVREITDKNYSEDCHDCPGSPGGLLVLFGQQGPDQGAEYFQQVLDLSPDYPQKNLIQSLLEQRIAVGQDENLPAD